MQAIVRKAAERFPGRWQLFDQVRLARLGTTAGLVLVTDRAVLVFAAGRGPAEALAVDLADFHAGCHGAPVLPVALLSGERVVAQEPLPLSGASPVIACSRLLLPGLLQRVARFPVRPGLDPATWIDAPYRPVPGLMQAACHLFARHDVADLLLAGAGPQALERTMAAIAAARSAGGKQIVFVTGQPGAGKTLCGLATAFSPETGGTFLTGNPALLHVLRGALARDAATRGLQAIAARQRIAAIVQPLHGFRDQYAHAGCPTDQLVVIDEAQRCWTAEHAVRKTRNKPIKLHQSEPAHLLDIMNRSKNHRTLLCLLGGGQEIHVGEGGMAAWGEALAARPEWHVSAPPEVLGNADPRQRLPALPNLRLDPALHLGSPTRMIHAPHQVAWVEAVLNGDATAARSIAADTLPIRLTRSLAAMRAKLTQGRRRAGLVASDGGRRLRAEGLGGLLWHQDEDAVARWFLDRWPDIRSAAALEVAATEFGVQGLELDRIGVCWDLDWRRDRQGWAAHAFRATAWTRPLAGEARSNKQNTYRVLLTRARHDTIIWVPRGNASDPTRMPDQYNAIADFLQQCGVPWLDEAQPAPQDTPMPEPVLL